MNNNEHRTRTLWLCAMLHGFTHVYGVALIPLYVLMRKDLGLTGEAQAPLLITAMGIAYCLPSYPLGMLADRLNRKTLLATGLAINALAFIILAFAHSYTTVLLAAIAAGFGGSFFHPSATALIARLFPEATGKALGRMGIGASLGFFIAPIYAGWRAASAGWRAPTLELGIFGLAGTLVFLWLADDHPALPRTKESVSADRLFATPALFWLFIGAAMVFSLRDFAGSGMTTLGSLFLQRAHGFTPEKTGLALSCIFLASAFSNPLFGSLSDRGRIKWSAAVLILAALVIVSFPFLSPQWFMLAFAAYGFFFMASYPMVEAGLMESVHDGVRGRVYGLFLTVGGIVGNLGHWFVGQRVNNLGSGATAAKGYVGIYGFLGLLVLLSIGGLACLRGLRKQDSMPAQPGTDGAVPSKTLKPAQSSPEARS